MTITHPGDCVENWHGECRSCRCRIKCDVREVMHLADREGRWVRCPREYCRWWVRVEEAKDAPEAPP